MGEVNMKSVKKRAPLFNSRESLQPIVTCLCPDNLNLSLAAISKTQIID